MTDKQLNFMYNQLKKADRLDDFTNYIKWARECLELIKEYSLENENSIKYDGLGYYLDEKSNLDSIYDYIVEGKS